MAPVIEAAAERIERDRQVPADVMAALHEAALFRLCLPHSIGGDEATPATAFAVLEAIAAADASTAWCLGQALGCTFAAAYVDREVALDVFGPPDAVLAWGPASPSAKAVAVDGGYRLTGEWKFASGARNATWLGAHCAIYEPDGGRRLDSEGRPVNRTVLFPKASAEVIDAWQVIGLKGTGSDNYAVADLFIPDGYTFARDSAPDRRESGPLYLFPLTTFYGMAFAGVAQGIARATLDAFLHLSADKTARGATTVLRDNASIQSQVALAEARLGSSRAYLMECIAESWHTACSPDAFPLDQRARLRIASTYAMTQARDVVDFAYYAAGANAIFESDPFERRFRDMHAVSQQVQAQATNFELAGMVMLGLQPPGDRI